MLSLRAFAKGLKVSHTAVVKGVADGRLRESVGRDAHGRPVIADERRARQEWRENASKPPPRRRGGTLLEAQRRERLAKARLAELRLKERRRELVPRVATEHIMTRVVAEARSSFLGLHAKLGARHPELPRAVILDLDSLVREILGDLANGARRQHGDVTDEDEAAETDPDAAA